MSYGKLKTNGVVRYSERLEIVNGMRYCIDEFLDAVRMLSYSNYDVLLVDNPRLEDFYRELRKREGVEVIWDQTKEELPVKRLVSSRNKILEYAVENGYDYVFMLDSDVIPPKNIIEELLQWKKDIISGLYYNYFKSSGQIKLLPVAWMEVTAREFVRMQEQVKFPTTIQSHRDLQRHMTQEEAESDNVYEVLYPSAGCMLLSKSVFSKIRYGVPKAPDGVVGTDDIYFIKKAREAGFSVFCYTKMKCEHLIKGKHKKDEDGRLLHPLSPEYSKHSTSV